MFDKKQYDYYSETIGEPLVTILYIGLSKASRLTTLRLFYDYWLRLFQKLLRLFQPERYDYC